MGHSVPPPILVVEDDDATREALTRILEISGYDVVASTDGIEGLAYLRGGGQVATIVMDIEMPNMDGMSFRRALSADPRFADIPIIVYTGSAEWGVPRVAGVVRKGSDSPYRLLELLAAVAPHSSSDALEGRPWRRTS